MVDATFSSQFRSAGAAVMAPDDAAAQGAEWNQRPIRRIQLPRGTTLSAPSRLGYSPAPRGVGSRIIRILTEKSATMFRRPCHVNRHDQVV